MQCSLGRVGTRLLSGGRRHVWSGGRRRLPGGMEYGTMGSTRVSSVSSSVSSSSEMVSTHSSEQKKEEGRGKTFRGRRRIADLLEEGAHGAAGNGEEEVVVRGWVRTVRDQKKFAFIEINDGSNLSGLQVVLNADSAAYGTAVRSGRLATGAAVCATGKLAASPGGKQSVELHAEKIDVVGECDASTYVLQKKRHSLEFLRGHAHLRTRTNTIGAAMRVRSRLAQATHEFFKEKGFLYVHTPIITASDCEGAGEQFCVTTLDLGSLGGGKAGFQAKEEDKEVGEDAVGSLKAKIAIQGEVVREAKAEAKAGTVGVDVDGEVKELLRLKAALSAAEEDAAAPSGAAVVDHTQDFFGRQAFLTVSGQLNAEIFATSLGDVYTFGPTFRAENSNTARHLAEFWMIEPELAFADLNDDIACAEAFLKHCLSAVLADCKEDLSFFDQRIQKGLIERLERVIREPFARITYTEAVDTLISSGKKFEYAVEWGNDLQSEHERYLTEIVFDGIPVVVTDYPKGIKAFYMRLNDDDKTVAAMDVLVPGVGEIIGGSQREERLEVLERRMKESNLPPEPYWWYMDLRRYGTVPHAGFGLGFERLVQYCTGLSNIRDVIPFPRYPGSADF